MGDFPGRRGILTILSVVLILSSYKVHGLTCLKCNSMIDPLCRMGFAKVQHCPPESIGCLTYIGVMPPPLGNMVIRDCTDMPSPGFCSNAMGHEVCTLTCYRNKCNRDTVDEEFMLNLQNAIL